jgi:hypothetical protein
MAEECDWLSLTYWTLFVVSRSIRKRTSFVGTVIAAGTS